MAAKHKAENRARPGSIPPVRYLGRNRGRCPRPVVARARVGTWIGGAPSVRWRAFREWAAQELTTGRLLPWFAVAYGAGVVLYFTAEREPALWAAAVPAAVCALGAPLRLKSKNITSGFPSPFLSTSA